MRNLNYIVTLQLAFGYIRLAFRPSFPGLVGSSLSLFGIKTLNPKP